MKVSYIAFIYNVYNSIYSRDLSLTMQRTKKLICVRRLLESRLACKLYCEEYRRKTYETEKGTLERESKRFMKACGIRSTRRKAAANGTSSRGSTRLAASSPPVLAEDGLY